MTTQRKRYAIVGTGGRSRMFIDAVCKKDSYADYGQLVGMCDLSQKRMDWYNQTVITAAGAPAVPTYKPDEFDRMIKETKPDCVIVTTMDSVHHEYICRAMELGCDAITEKPMTTDAAKARQIFDTVARTGKNLRVTFNYRYMPQCTQVRRLVMQGAIGKPTSVEFLWTLDTRHGADYFRRWHREKDKSGGLLVHKATHHFDLVNFWISSIPKTVFAMGDLKFYGRANAEARGERYDYHRYTGVEQAKDDPFALDLTSRPGLRELYLDAEEETGYLRDRNVFGDDITIEDTMAVVARYRNGVILNYSLIAYCPWEGYRVAINGTRGRIEFVDKHGSHIIAGQSDEDLSAEQKQAAAEADSVEKDKYIKVYPMFGRPYLVDVPTAEGGHGGGDRIMLEQIFHPNPPADPFNRSATHIDGAASILMGVAANQSIETGLPVDVDTLVMIPEGETAAAGA